MGELHDGMEWAERHAVETGSWVAGGVSSAWRWTGRQANRVGSAVAQGGVEALSAVDSRVAPLVLGHYYDTVIPMGVFHRVSPAMLLEAIRHNPKHFPIFADKDFEPGAVVTLMFEGTRNPVIVEKIDTSDPKRASMLLRTQSGHFFSGTAEHIVVRLPGDRLAWEVIGHGPPRELWDRKQMNLAFGRDMWPRLVRQRVLPIANRLEQGG